MDIDDRALDRCDERGDVGRAGWRGGSGQRGRSVGDRACSERARLLPRRAARGERRERQREDLHAGSRDRTAGNRLITPHTRATRRRSALPTRGGAAAR
jgi:hypothetical protein